MYLRHPLLYTERRECNFVNILRIDTDNILWEATNYLYVYYRNHWKTIIIAIINLYYRTLLLGIII